MFYNCFMREKERVTFTNMCLIYHDDMILVQERTKKDWPGLTFPGGHVEKGENFMTTSCCAGYNEFIKKPNRGRCIIKYRGLCIS